MKIVKKYERSEGIIILYHLLNLIDATFRFPKNIEDKMHELFTELNTILDSDLPDFDITDRKLIEQLTFEKES